MQNNKKKWLAEKLLVTPDETSDNPIFNAFNHLWKFIGGLSAILYAVGCGLTTSGALITLATVLFSITTAYVSIPLIVVVVLASGIGIAAAYKNLQLCEQTGSQIIFLLRCCWDLFKRNPRHFTYLEDVQMGDELLHRKGDPVGKGKQVGILLSLILAIGNGVLMGFLTYVFTLAMLTALATTLGGLGLLLVSASPVIAVVIAIATAVAQTFLLHEAFYKLICQSESYMARLKQHSFHQGAQLLWQNKGKVLLYALAGIGLVMAYWQSGIDLSQHLTNFGIQANQATQHIVAVVATVWGALADAPFVFRTTYDTLRELRADYRADVIEDENSRGWWFASKIFTGTMLNAIGNAAIAANGASQMSSGILRIALIGLAFVGGLMNSFAAMIGPELREKAAREQQTTAVPCHTPLPLHAAVFDVSPISQPNPCSTPTETTPVSSVTSSPSTPLQSPFMPKTPPPSFFLSGKKNAHPFPQGCHDAGTKNKVMPLPITPNRVMVP